MKINERYFRLYAVTDRAWHKKRSLTIGVRDALDGGATMVQLREKDVITQIYTNEAVAIKAVCQKYRVPLVIYDNIGAVFGSNADGLHIDQADITLQTARAELGPNTVLGKTVHTLEQAKNAQADGADYLTVAPIFATETNQGAELVQLDTLREITSAVSIPVCIAGGINAESIAQLAGLDIAGVAVSEAIFADFDTKIPALNLRALIDETLR